MAVNDAQLLSRVDKIEKDLSQLVAIISEETASRRVFEERMTNAITIMAETNKRVASLQEKQYNMELYLAKEVATVSDRQKLHSRIDTIEHSQRRNSWILDGGVHIVWLIVAAIVGFFGYKLKGGG